MHQSNNHCLGRLKEHRTQIIGKPREPLVPLLQYDPIGVWASRLVRSHLAFPIKCQRFLKIMRPLKCQSRVFFSEAISWQQITATQKNPTASKRHPIHKHQGVLFVAPPVECGTVQQPVVKHRVILDELLGFVKQNGNLYNKKKT